jgi:hypothetical protein
MAAGGLFRYFALPQREANFMNVYEVPPRKDHRSVNLISDALHALGLTALCD